MRDRTGWKQSPGFWGRKKNLIEFTRFCAAPDCGREFGIMVTQKIASGKADSNSFGLKNCELHRRGKIVDELETLRAEIAVLKRRDQELFAENMALKAKLAALEKKMPWE